MDIKRASLALALGITFHIGVAHAAESVSVEADQMEIIDAEHRTIFKGNVIAVRPTDQIKSDEMVVTNKDVKQSDGTMQSVTDLLDAKGNVVITTKTQTITGNAAKFFVLLDKLEVTGNVLVKEGKSVIKGEKLNVDLKTNRLLMSGGLSGGRVKGSFVPK
jgi:lipopolysaccharide export system protein LptA